MASTALSAKAVGSIVKLNVNGSPRDFIVVHQGKPGSMYDESCNGTWLLMKDIYENRQWHSSNVNDYQNSTIHSYLNSTFLGLFDPEIQAVIKQVKIPYRKGSGTSKTVTSGANGLSAKIFLLSSTEVSFNHNYMPTNEGAELSYFAGCADSGSDNKRVAYLNSSATYWWLRSPYTSYFASNALRVNTNGDWYGYSCSSSYGVRPALVLPSTLFISDDGTVKTNEAPVITSTSGESGVNLGEKSATFSIHYSVSDSDGDTLTITEKVDGVAKKTRESVTSGSEFDSECVSDAADFQKLVNGEHTITIEVSDGSDTTTFTATFTKAVHKATITLDEPLAVEGDISVAILGIVGSIPDDASLLVEATNNGSDPEPVWQDVTDEVLTETNIVFENHANTNGAAFNFRITVERGESDEGGYITSVSGAFE